MRGISDHSSDQTTSCLQDLNDSIDALREKINTQLVTQLKVYPDVLKDTQSLFDRLQVLNHDIDSSAAEILKKERHQFESIYTSYENRISEFNNLQQIIHALELLQRLTSTQEKCKAAVETGDVPSTISLYLESEVFVSKLSNDFNLQQTSLVMKAIDDLAAVQKWTEDYLKTDISKFFRVEKHVIEIGKPSAPSEETMKHIERMQLSFVVAKYLHENLFKPLMDNVFSNMDVDISICKKTDKILLSFSNRTFSVTDLDQKLDSICSVFQSLAQSFLGTTYAGSERSSESTFLKFMYSELSLGQTIVDKIYSSILKEFLPTSVLELTNYKKDAITKCEQVLFQLGLSDISNCFENFRENLTCYFVASFVSNVLCKSRELIRGDKQVTCVVGDWCENGLVAGSTLEEKYHHLPTLDHKYKSFLTSPILYCPSITVSQNIRDVVDLLISSVEEASQMEELSAASEMYQCCEDVVYLFCDLVSTSNPNSELPFMEANVLQREKLVLNSFFIDQNPIFAASHASLASSAVAQTISPHELLKPLEKCMFYIENRCNLWKPPVLSKNSFTLAISFLLNFVLQYVVNYCITFEDITTSDAESLEKVLQLAQDKCTSLVSQISQHCLLKKEERSSFYDSTLPEYQRLCWIKKLLGLGLLEIHSQWNSPNSELKVHISPDELKSLIRALFQNTELRSQILSSIKQSLP